MLTKSLDILHF